MSGYFLPPHVHFCQRGDAFVFLDLKQDDYTLVNGASATALQALSKQMATPAFFEHDLKDALNELLKGGLLTTESNGRAIAPTHIDPAVENLVDRETLLDTSVSLGQMVNCFAACITAKLSLRWRSIEATVMSVARRKAEHASDRPFDLERARALTAAFLKARGLFPANYLCLFDSLALLHFLAKYGIYPTWVFAVNLEPWAAHCWVQHQHHTFNEDAEQAVTYTPVMVI
ncbi:MAG TPA: lasso peptide biosynthesis B2 protein [Steroidobacter sp.]|uniref:lasso peptide biosynthesis B2 protein n=1 Tax=Steroidobacter sp. TaxID=1978227 RepID=UPI002EDB1C0B